MNRQLAFDLPTRAALGRCDFFVSPGNALALATLDGWRDWPQGKMLLVGPAGAGKTHLAHVWAQASGAALVAAGDLGAADLPALLARGAVAVEDAETLAASPGGEHALFHLHNLAAAAGAALLVTAASPPRDWGLTLPDLASRMQSAALIRLSGPDDALLSAVLVKQFADRQIAVPPALIPWLVQRIDRSFDAARAVVARLDAHALAEGRAITRQLAADLIERPDAGKGY
ncbi:DnaA/Hda family protein [Paracoccaceae bacterium Fryx2]|nr:DnaA/Hda family protein [Paracoccaceae bacterium Fryx2]